jgi:hypothetical protein
MFARITPLLTFVIDCLGWGAYIKVVTFILCYDYAAFSINFTVHVF